MSFPFSNVLCIGDSKGGGQGGTMAPPAENCVLRSLVERLQYRLALLVLVFL